jgi:hypothetical protein
MSKYSLEYVKDVYLKRGFVLESNEYINCKKKMVCYDRDGYKYFINFDSFINNKTSECFDRFGKSNPFSIFNIRNWLKIKKDDFSYIEEVPYEGVEQKLTFVDNDGYYYWLSFTHLRSHFENGDNSFAIIHCGNKYSIKNIKRWIELNNKTFTLVDGQEYQSGDRKLLFHCNICNPDEDNYSMTWDNVFQGQKCPYCSGKKVGKYNNFKCKYPKIAEEWSEKNYPLKPEDIAPFDNSNYYWRCNKCDHDFFTTSGSRINGSGCPYCSNANRKANDINNLYVSCPELMLDWDWGKNKENNLDPCKLVPPSGKYASWICHTCGHNWDAVIFSRTGLKCGCPKCGKEKASKNKRKSAAEISNLTITYPDLVKEWSGLNSSKPEEFSYGCQDVVYWKCLAGFDHPDYPARIANRTILHRGCPLCSESHGEKFIRKFLDLKFVKYIKQYRFDNCRDKRPLPFDFAIFDNNNNLLMVCEYQGKQHYESLSDYFKGDKNKADKAFESQQKRDKIKKDYCIKNGIYLLEIPYWDQNNIPEILTKELNLN